MSAVFVRARFELFYTALNFVLSVDARVFAVNNMVRDCNGLLKRFGSAGGFVPVVNQLKIVSFHSEET